MIHQRIHQWIIDLIRHLCNVYYKKSLTIIFLFYKIYIIDFLLFFIINATHVGGIDSQDYPTRMSGMLNTYTIIFLFYNFFYNKMSNSHLKHVAVW